MHATTYPMRYGISVQRMRSTHPRADRTRTARADARALRAARQAKATR